MGGPGFFDLFFALFMIISGGNTGNDLIGMMPTDSYWHAKNVTVTLAQLEADIAPRQQASEDFSAVAKQLESLSKRDAAKQRLEEAGAAALPALRAEANSDDPEAAAAAKDLIAKFAAAGHAHDIRRLMAIRTLGERKEKDALPQLKNLLDSKEHFVAEYAERAIAQIDGTPIKPVDHHADLASDLDLFPRDSGVVGQVIGVGEKGFTLDAAAAQFLDMTPAANGKPAAKADLADRLTGELVAIAERTGNVRIDGLSFALSSDIGGTNNWFMVSFHGVYDKEAIMALASSMFGNNKPYKIGNIDAIEIDQEASFLFPSDHQALFVVIDVQHVPPETILKPLAAALDGGKGNLSDNKALSDLIKTVDQSGPAWVAGIPSPTMRQVPMFTPFDAMTLTTIAEGENFRLTLRAHGGTATEATAAVDTFAQVRGEILESIHRQATENNQLQPLIDLITSSKVTAEDNGASASFLLSKSLPKALMSIALQEIGRRILASDAPAQAPMTQPLP